MIPLQDVVDKQQKNQKEEKRKKGKIKEIEFNVAEQKSFRNFKYVIRIDRMNLKCDD